MWMSETEKKFHIRWDLIADGQKNRRKIVERQTDETKNDIPEQPINGFSSSQRNTTHFKISLNILFPLGSYLQSQYIQLARYEVTTNFLPIVLKKNIHEMSGI